MPHGSKPWTARILKILEDGQVHKTDDVIADAGQLVSEDEALNWLGPDRNTTQNTAARVAAGRRSIVRQALHGRVRFGAVSYVDSTKKEIRLGAGSSGSIAGLLTQVAELTARLAEVEDRLSKLDGVSTEESPLDALAEDPASIPVETAP